MQLYGLKTCDTCRKALRVLPKAEFVDVREAGVPMQVLKTALANFGDSLVNTRSTTWRGLDAETRALPALELLVAHPSLMKRPLIVDAEKMWLGWGADVQAELSRG
ncbi:MAG: ArsC/Spx/MgsR family protein [Pseudomonadota bacterium]